MCTYTVLVICQVLWRVGLCLMSCGDLQSAAQRPQLPSLLAFGSADPTHKRKAGRRPRWPASSHACDTAPASSYDTAPPGVRIVDMTRAVDMPPLRCSIVRHWGGHVTCKGPLGVSVRLLSFSLAGVAEDCACSLYMYTWHRVVSSAFGHRRRRPRAATAAGGRPSCHL